MTIYLSKNTDANNKIDKTLIDRMSLNGTLKGDTSVVSPTILIEHSNPTAYNYAQIPSFNRNYFIDDIINVRNNLWQLYLKCDVLTTYKTQLKSLYAVIEKSQTNTLWDQFLDQDIIADQRCIYNTFEPINQTHNFNPSQSSYILVTAGDPNNSSNIYIPT